MADNQYKIPVKIAELLQYDHFQDYKNNGRNGLKSLQFKTVDYGWLYGNDYEKNLGFDKAICSLARYYRIERNMIHFPLAGASENQIDNPLIDRQTNLQAEAEQIEQASNEEELGSLEEELADLEELWDEKPYLLKKSLLEIIIDKIVLDQRGRRFYSLQIVWKIKEWGIQQTYIDRGNGNKLWSREEEEVLQSLYPSASTKEDLLQALPTRTWEGIEKRASVLRIRRVGRTEDKIDQTLAYRDRLFLEEENLCFASFAPVSPGYKFTGWTSHTVQKHLRLVG